MERRKKSRIWEFTNGFIRRIAFKAWITCIVRGGQKKKQKCTKEIIQKVWSISVIAELK